MKQSFGPQPGMVPYGGYMQTAGPPGYGPNVNAPGNGGGSGRGQGDGGGANVSGVNGGGDVVDEGKGGVHPEREANVKESGVNGGGSTAPFGRGDGFENGAGRGRRRMDMGPPRGGMMRSPYNEPRGRRMLFHVEEPTRTRRSYREVDIEFPEEEDAEEIDYGFGDFDKNPTKFNL